MSGFHLLAMVMSKKGRSMGHSYYTLLEPSVFGPTNISLWQAMMVVFKKYIQVLYLSEKGVSAYDYNVC